MELRCSCSFHLQHAELSGTATIAAERPSRQTHKRGPRRTCLSTPGASGIYLGYLPWRSLEILGVDCKIGGLFFFCWSIFCGVYDAKSSIACSQSASAMQKPSYPVPLVTKLCSRWPLGCKKRGQFQPGLKTHCCCHSQYGTTRDYLLLYINTSYKDIYIYIYGTIGCTMYIIYIYICMIRYHKRLYVYTVLTVHPQRKHQENLASAKLAESVRSLKACHASLEPHDRDSQFLSDIETNIDMK